MPEDDRDIVAELGELLEKVGARVTFDPERSISKPCHICATTAASRTLIEVGAYTISFGNTLKGDPIFRPVCTRCLACPEPTCERLRGHDGLHVRRNKDDQSVEMWG